MSQCLNPDCLHSNPIDSAVCQRCESQMLLGGRYRAIRSLGSGGFSRTFAAVDEHRLQTPCVIKQFLPPPIDSSHLDKSIALFKQEALILKELGNHPQIPSLLAFLEQEGRLYLIQEFIEGQDLFKEATEQGLFTEQQVLQLFMELLPILQFIHEQKVVHRDIKPGNILRQPNGSLVLIDFGGSFQVAGAAQAVTGTPGYAAPEQILGRVEVASDLHSLAVTGARLLTGYLGETESDPFADPQQRHLMWHRLQVKVGPELRSIFANLLQPDVRQRYQSAVEVWQALSPRRNSKTSVQAISGKSFQPLMISSIPNTELVSDVGADFTHLQRLLAQHNYAAADQETWSLMLEIAGIEDQKALTIGCLQNFPGNDLQTIDRLWTELSGGHFGFSVQQHLYQRLGGRRTLDYAVWQTFGKHVGWLVDGEWLNYNELQFEQQAPIGHLPACFVDSLNRKGSRRGVCGWWRLGFVTMTQRLETVIVESRSRIK
ncbi:MAG: protein kinase [Acaryochloridaceae cyanobacterium SU_2_1]|nr:protein kinase [Acaryochloridaceae cyanobacterium SU_2_1]